MALSLGASHAATGTGTVAVSSPAGLRVSFTTIPAFLGSDAGTPREYYRMGRVNVGTSLGYLAHYEIVCSPQLLLGLPPGITVVAWDLAPGIVATIHELVDSPVVNLAQPWDRGAVAWSRTFNQQTALVVAETSGWTYTVPTGKFLWVSSAALWVSCSATQTAGTRTILRMYLAGSIFQELLRYALLVGQREQEAMGTGPLVIPAGIVINATYQVNTAGGNIDFGAHASGFLFDA